MGRGWQLPLEQGWPARLNTQTTHTHMHAYTTHLQHICLHTWQTIKSSFILPPLSHLHICSPHMCSSSVQSLLQSTWSSESTVDNWMSKWDTSKLNWGRPPRGRRGWRRRSDYNLPKSKCVFVTVILLNYCALHKCLHGLPMHTWIYYLNVIAKTHQTFFET